MATVYLVSAVFAAVTSLIPASLTQHMYGSWSELIYLILVPAVSASAFLFVILCGIPVHRWCLRKSGTHWSVFAWLGLIAPTIGILLSDVISGTPPEVAAYLLAATSGLSACVGFYWSVQQILKNPQRRILQSSPFLSILVGASVTLVLIIGKASFARSFDCIHGTFNKCDLSGPFIYFSFVPIFVAIVLLSVIVIERFATVRYG